MSVITLFLNYFLISLFSCPQVYTQQTLEIKFYNRTGKNIDSLLIGERYIGYLKTNQETEYLTYKSFLFDNSYPCPNISGYIGSEKVNKKKLIRCSTDDILIISGKYEFDLISDNSLIRGLQLQLREHEK